MRENTKTRSVNVRGTSSLITLYAVKAEYSKVSSAMYTLVKYGCLHF